MVVTDQLNRPYPAAGCSHTPGAQLGMVSQRAKASSSAIKPPGRKTAQHYVENPMPEKNTLPALAHIMEQGCHSQFLWQRTRQCGAQRT